MTDAKDAPSRHPLAALWAPQTIRARCADVLRSVEDEASAHFKLDRSALPALAERLAAELLHQHPNLQLPAAGCWPLFDAGGVPRLADLAQQLAGRSPAEVVRAHVDLTVITALLSGHAGEAWRYSETTALAPQALPAHRQDRDDLLAQLDQAAAGRAAAETPEPQAIAPAAVASLQGTEGLAVATLRAFMAGAFSAHADDPLRADAKALAMIDPAALRAIFQARPSNPLVGLEGRAALLARLGQVLLADSAQSGLSARPCLLYERMSGSSTNTDTGTVTDTDTDTSTVTASVTASALLQEILRSLGPIWASGSRVLGLPAGDVWQHLWAGAGTGVGTGSSSQDAATGGAVPFHQSAQTLVVALVEPLQAAGLHVSGIDALTGLPGPANGSLFIDAGVIVPRQASSLTRTWKPGDELVVEWRALTVMLLDELAALLRTRLAKTAAELPLAPLLQAITAGHTGARALKLESDGTLF